jgi:colanic acid/amylovoran biosynthesis protein
MKFPNKYIIIPGCSDLNRGDQALVWETKRIAEDAGFKGEYYLTSEKNEPVAQSEKFGLNIIRPILEHPSRLFDNKNNVNYTPFLKFKWGIVALNDLLVSLLFLNKITRVILKNFISTEKKNSISVMENSSAFFVKGGGLIHSYGGITATYSIYFSVYHIILASSLKKPIYIMPNSFGPFEGLFVKKIVKYAFKKCKFISAREAYSQAMVKKELGMEIENYPDLAFFLSNSDLDKHEIFKKHNLPYDKKIVALTMRPHRFPKSKTPKEDYLKFKLEIALFIKWLTREGFMPLLIEHTFAINNHENDGSCIKDVVDLLDKNCEFRVFSNKEFTCHELKSVYSYCDYIIGTRFHSVIFSISNNVPGIAITYAGNKGQGIMKDIGIENLTIPIDLVSSKVLQDKFTFLLRNESIVKEKILKYNILASKKRNEFIKSLKTKLEN